MNGFPCRFRFGSRFVAGFLRPSRRWAGSRGTFLTRAMFRAGMRMAGMAARLVLSLGLARWLNTTQGPAQIIQFTLVGEFLAFGHFHQFQNFVDAVDHVAQRFGNLRGMRHGLMNGGSIRRAEIRRLDPLLGARRFLTAIFVATILPVLPGLVMLMGMLGRM